MARPKNTDQPIPRIEAPPRRCPTCDCTEHTPYEARFDVVLEYAGQTVDGKPYDLVIKRHCGCANCGQRMIHTFLELTADWIKQREAEEITSPSEVKA